MSDDTTNNIDTTTPITADDAPVVTPENGIPQSAPVPAEPIPETEIEKSL
jgi:hypothetical protein